MKLQSATVIQLTIAFQPKTPGVIVDTLTVMTDDPDTPAATVQLKGRGINQ